MCTGSAPWPYITAGILLSRRILRAAPLPNWVRIWATSLVSDTSFSWCCSGCLGVAHAGRGTAHTSLICLVGFWCGGPRRGARHGLEGRAAPSNADRAPPRRSRTPYGQPYYVPRRGNPRSLGDRRRDREVRVQPLDRRGRARGSRLGQPHREDAADDEPTAGELHEPGP